MFKLREYKLREQLYSSNGKKILDHTGFLQLPNHKWQPLFLGIGLSGRAALELIQGLPTEIRFNDLVRVYQLVPAASISMTVVIDPFTVRLARE